MGIINRLFKKNEGIEELDIEKEVGKYLIELPRCGRDIIIISPKYGETNYKCEIYMTAKDLLPWAEHHASACWSTNQRVQAARIALPLWLRGADSSNNTAANIPYYMYEVLRMYASGFVKEGIARVYCQDCRSFIVNPKIDKYDERGTAGWSFWTDHWECCQGHLLYHEEQEARFYPAHLPKN